MRLGGDPEENRDGLSRWNQQILLFKMRTWLESHLIAAPARRPQRAQSGGFFAFPLLNFQTQSLLNFSLGASVQQATDSTLLTLSRRNQFGKGMVLSRCLSPMPWSPGPEHDSAFKSHLSALHGCTHVPALAFLCHPLARAGLWALLCFFGSVH